ncbi:hypothetical protein MLD38_028789 [Melastoma candidum]|uniref:Uncharacterized protein n=1 Tax=Melastoma candidum TaxID=119954 RepID=A0ACB9N245_9MYRT|nr:hypothetical protein MLD38_028789 [Melastoma candidum]
MPNVTGRSLMEPKRSVAIAASREVEVWRNQREGSKECLNRSRLSLSKGTTPCRFGSLTLHEDLFSAKNLK